MDLYRGMQSLEGLIEDEAGDNHESECIEKGRQNAGAMIAEGLGCIRRTRLNEHGNPGEQQGQQIRDVVACLREKSKAVSADSRHHGQQYVQKSSDYGIAQNARAGWPMRMAVIMHAPSSLPLIPTARLSPGTKKGHHRKDKNRPQKQDLQHSAAGRNQNAKPLRPRGTEEAEEFKKRKA